MSLRTMVSAGGQHAPFVSLTPEPHDSWGTWDRRERECPRPHKPEGAGGTRIGAVFTAAPVWAPSNHEGTVQNQP